MEFISHIIVGMIIGYFLSKCYGVFGWIFGIIIGFLAGIYYIWRRYG